MATTDDLTQVVTDLSTAFAPMPAAIDALEAAVTAAKNAGMSSADQAKIDAAVGSLRNIVTAVQAAVTDATDGVDEAAPTAP